MKKILTLLMGLSLTTTAVNTVISCQTNNMSEEERGGFDYQGDLKILNVITRWITDVIQQYETEETLIDIRDYSIPEFEKLFSIVTADKPVQELELKDKTVAPALSTLMTSFMTVFDRVNYEIAHEYSNYYHNSFPMIINQNTMKFNLNYIGVDKLGAITRINTNGLKGVRLDFKLEIEIQFKTLKTRVPLMIQYTITNDDSRMSKILSAVTGAVSKAIVKSFNINSGDIIVDQNPAYRKIYDNFDLNYAFDHSMVDMIVQKELDTALQGDEELGDIRKIITYAPDKEILTLLTAIINPDTNGVTPQLPEDEKYTWVNTGYAPDKLTPENFLEYYGKKLNILTSTSGPKLQLGQLRLI